jgi:hypothetical protein
VPESDTRVTTRLSRVFPPKEEIEEVTKQGIGSEPIAHYFLLFVFVLLFFFVDSFSHL